jgi:hypothetical protein
LDKRLQYSWREHFIAIKPKTKVAHFAIHQHQTSLNLVPPNVALAHQKMDLALQYEGFLFSVNFSTMSNFYHKNRYDFMLNNIKYSVVALSYPPFFSTF